MPDTIPTNDQRTADVVSQLDAMPSNLELHPPEKSLRGPRLPGAETVGQRRKLRMGLENDPLLFLSLNERADGSLSWGTGLGASTGVTTVPGMRRGRRASSGDSLLTRTVKLFKTDRMPVNEIAQYLGNLDDELTPDQGLRLWNEGKFARLSSGHRVSGAKRVLLFIHGTFSKSESFTDQLPAELMAELSKRYNGEIYAFDHPTLSVSPVINAIDLARYFPDLATQVDVIAHSRGGLVARWWREAFDGAAHKGRTMLVGSPLGGTSLAAPHKLRSTLDLLTSATKIIGKAAATQPILWGVAGLARVFASITSLAANTPVADAVVSMVPGLSAQARNTTNFELSRLRSAKAASYSDYCVISSDYQPNPLMYRFWQRFRGEPVPDTEVTAKFRAINAAADIVFECDNDLVVDTESMSEFFKPLETYADLEHLHLPQALEVHHCRYFEVDEVHQKIRSWLPA